MIINDSGANSGLNRLLALVLKALFTREELKVLIDSGISLQSVLYSGAYDSVMRGEGQKTIFPLMGRWKLDKNEDALLFWMLNEEDQNMLRYNFGPAEWDDLFGEKGEGIMKNLFSYLSGTTGGTINDLRGLLQKLGILSDSFEKQYINDLTGQIVESEKRAFINRQSPVITLDKIETRPEFIRLVSEDGDTNWYNI